MNNSKFKQLKTNIISLEVLKNFHNKIVSVKINNIKYSKSKNFGNLTKKQLEFFEYLPDYKGKEITL